jgi:ubiquinone/menaquinone biosynthesis C-methylase UbiE
MGDKDRELAYRFDLFITPEWSERFDEVVTKHFDAPEKGRILEINSGTGGRAIALSEKLKDGEVVGVDTCAERVAIAQAKAQSLKAERCSFVQGDPEHLVFDDESFDAVIADASLAPPDRLTSITAEATRVAREGAPVGVAVTLRGSFDEFYSIYWEVLHEVGLAEEVWTDLEALITARPTADDALAALRAAGVPDVTPHRRKEEFRFDTGGEFLASPLVADLFLNEWLAIVPFERLGEVRAAIERVIDRERAGYYFDVSAKTLVATGHKRA